MKWIKELRKTEKGRILFKFILYMMFFLFVLVLVFVGNASRDQVEQHPSYSKEPSSESETVEDKEISFLKKQEKLISGKYEFMYKIETDDATIQYYGEYDAKTVEGLRETEDDLIKYSIEDGIVYKHIFDEKEIFDGLYLDFDSSLFDIERLFNKLNSTTAIIEKKEKEKTYNYVLDEYKYTVFASNLEITKIEIETSDVKYTFEYTY